MAEKALLESFLSCHHRLYGCHMCSETFRDPVSLSCGHSFCSSCLQQFWEQAGNKNCPICKRKSSKDYPSINYSLKELADSFVGKQSSGSPEQEKEKEEKEKEEEVVEEEDQEKEEEVCEKHPDVPYWFCEDEQKAVCPVCEFSLHQSHKVTPIEEAVSDLKEQLKSDLQTMQDKLDKHKQVEKTYIEMIQHSKKQVLSTERQIRAEFNKLHQLLKEEEESRLAALREEEEQKGKTMSREMKTIEEQISSLSDSICAVEEELQKHNVPFLSSYKATQTRARAQCSVSDPQLLSGALIDVAKHLGNLSFRVWEKIKEKLHFTPVILDPNTAHPILYLSDDLASVRRGETFQQQLPDNPERNTKYITVLGSEGFSSGKHSWEVEVGDHPNWTVGLAKESFDRKGECSASTKYGIWCFFHRDGKYINGVGQPLTVKKSLQRIKVQLDYKGEVSFYHSEDLTHIYTYRDTFTEKLLPYFNIRKSGDAKTYKIKMCPTKISL